MNCPWHEYELASVSFCESRLCAWIQTPANTWSNLAYLLFGIYLWYLARKDRRVDLLPIGITSCLVAVGSFLFHATGTFWGEVLDVGAMYFFANYIVVYNAFRLGWLRGLFSIVGAYSVFNLVSVLALVYNKPLGILIFAILVTIAGILEIWLFRYKVENISRKNLYRLIVFFSVSYFIWNLDYHKIVCDPDNHFLQGHAAWHIINSFCFYFLYLYYKQLHPSNEAQS